MKALAICQLLAFLDVARSGRPPAHDLVFLATADEETGSDYGMKWIIANRPDVLAGIRYGITEGGITEMQAERMTYFGIEVGGKQEIDVRIEGDDHEAMRAVRIALEPFMFSREPERVLPVVREYFRNMSSTRVEYRDELADIDRTIRDGVFWRLPAPYRDLTQNSLWVSVPRRSSENEPWSMNVKMVNLPDEIPEERLQWLTDAIEPYGLRIAEIRQKQGPVPVSSHETPLFTLLADEARRRYQVNAGLQVLYRSTTDARFLRPLGINCYGVSPYPVTLYQSITIHKPNERIHLDRFVEGVEFLRTVIRQWSATPA
jgi:acetylornithine deacetylase/succinyl-diaminopimelate desuccinylase-like protein